MIPRQTQLLVPVVNADRKREHAQASLAGDSDSPGHRRLDGSEARSEFLAIDEPYGNMYRQGEQRVRADP
jgi:hypothetical protein